MIIIDRAYVTFDGVKCYFPRVKVNETLTKLVCYYEPDTDFNIVEKEYKEIEVNNKFYLRNLRCKNYGSKAVFRRKK